MIEILLVEDDPKKRTVVRSVITDMLGEEQCRIIEVEVYIDAVNELKARRFDLLVLDLLIPRDAGNSPDPKMGETVLQQITGGRVKRPKYLVGLTAYSDRQEQYDEQFGSQGWRIIHFDPSSDEWETNLRNILIHVGDICDPLASSDYDYDVAIITALADVEQKAVLALDANWREKGVMNDDGLYHEGSVVSKQSGKPLRMVTAAAVRMGMPAATALSMKMIAHFKPKFLFMAGIAAGVSGQYGDVLVADQSWDYGSGKQKRRMFFGDEFQPAPEAILLKPYLHTRIAHFRTNKEVLEEISSTWKATPRRSFGVQIGPVASGAAVLQNRRIVNNIKKANRKLIGVEMETYGVYFAAETAPAPRPLACSVKSICDFGDRNKSDDYQEYAAFTSANFIYRLIQDKL